MPLGIPVLVVKGFSNHGYKVTFFGENPVRKSEMDSISALQTIKDESKAIFMSSGTANNH